MRGTGFFFLFILFYINLHAQDTMHSKYGKSLPAEGVLRILIVYAEVEYDINPEKDRQQNYPYRTWKPGKLPLWKDEMADPFPGMSEQKGLLTRFYNEMSFGDFIVLGDYVPNVITVKESETNSSSQTQVYNQKVMRKVCENGDFISAHGLGIKDFDLWTMTGFGKPKITPSEDDPVKIDHVMIIYRNIHSLAVDNGFASHGSAPQMCGFFSDTYSTFSSPDRIPFNVPKHEIAHLLLGDNNFHPYGNTVSSQSYFVFFPAMWSLLSSANATLLTCNSWDRDRLDWRAPGKNLTISTLNADGTEVSTDLDPANPESAGIYLLRDFVTTGDVIRIKIPLHEEERKYPQWLWIENHRTSKNNGSGFDHFQYEHQDCTEEATPGLYMFTQVAKNEKTGPGIYGGFHTYIRPVIANGNYDWKVEKDKQQNECVNDLWFHPYEKIMENPFTGSHHQEFPLFDLNHDGKIEYSEHLVPAIERKRGGYIKNLSYLGDSGNAFTKTGKGKISVSSNPSTAPVLNPQYGIQRQGSPANRTVLLNGISVEIMEEMADGTIKVLVKFDDVEINNDVRWCADTILLPVINKDGADLNLAAKKKIHLDQGLTTTGFTHPLNYKGQNVFAGPTVMECLHGTSVFMNNNSQFIVDNGSTLIINSEAEINLESRAEIVIKNGSTLIIDPGANVVLNKNSVISVDKTSSITYNEASFIKKHKRVKIKINGKNTILEP